MRVRYFQGHNAPGLEEEHQFKCLFVNTLHEDICFEVALFCRCANYPMQDIRRHAQTMWELRNRPRRTPEVDARVLGIQAMENPDLPKQLPKLDPTHTSQLDSRVVNRAKKVRNSGSLNNTTSHVKRGS